MSEPPSEPAGDLSPSAIQLLDAAERLFAERGLDRVSLREVAVAAGQRNTSAVHYHFGNRETLLRAVAERRMRPIDVQRNRRIDEFLAGPDAADAAELVRVSARALPEVVRDAPWGRDYVLIAAQTMSNPDLRLHRLVDPSVRSGSLRAGQLLRERLRHLDDLEFQHRAGIVTYQMMFSLARWMQANGAADSANLARFDALVEHTVDFLAAGMVAPARRLNGG